MKLMFEYSLAHFKKVLRPKHGPQVWPWWKILSIKMYSLNLKKQSFGKRVWVYTRFGALYFSVYVDRRELE